VYFRTIIFYFSKKNTVFTMKQLEVAFHHITRIIDLTKEEKLIFIQLVEVLEVKRHESLLTIGQVCKYEYFVLEGCIRSYYIDKNFDDITTMFAVSGYWTGDLHSFHKGIPSEYGLEAMEESLVIRISKSKLEEIYQRIPKFERYFRILLQNRVIAIDDQLANIAMGASQAYEHFLKRFPRMEQRVPLKHIASYLGITPTYLSRIRKKQFSKKKSY
jgi:CRP-like cAMP-binding protein